MKDFKVFTKKIPTKFIIIGDLEIELFELMQILEALEGTDALFRGVLIYNTELKEELEKRDVIVSNIKGTSGEGTKFKEFYDKIFELVYGQE